MTAAAYGAPGLHHGRQPGNRCSWVLLSAELVAVSAFSHEWAYDGLTRPGLLPFVPAATWLAGWTFAPYWLQISRR